jgi:alpha-galactosidase
MTTHSLDLLHFPDSVRVFTEGGDCLSLTSSHPGHWHGKDVTVATATQGDALSVTLAAPQSAVTRLHLRWHGDLSGVQRWLGDAWERGYGDLEWRSIVPERPMPWYCAAWDGERTDGYGVRTGPGAFCFWQADAEGLSLWADVRSGGVGLQLGERVLEVCDVVCREGKPQETPFAALHAFCQQMCPHPRLPTQPVYGHNDWYYAYGNNSETQILDDCRRTVALAPDGPNRPFVVIDAGWQPANGCDGGPWHEGNAKFPDMPGLASRIREMGAKPGLWIRPLAAAADAPSAWRFSRDAQYLDPTVPEVRQLITEDIARISAWGYDLIKHDFTTFDIMGRWGFTMGATLTDESWTFAAGSGQTTAEVIRNLYMTIREAAGASMVLGCNTVSHLSAGIFEMCRIGDDTSGRMWERTRKMGINSLAFRAAQHGTFYAADADCVGLTGAIPWELNRQWLDLLARSGTMTLVSADPQAIGPEQEQALRAAFAIAAQPQPLGEPLDWLETNSPARWRLMGEDTAFDWLGPHGASPFID